MIEVSTISILMSDMQDRKIKAIEEQGYLFPTLILFHASNLILVDDLRSKYDNILAIEYLTASDTIPVNATILTFRNQDDRDDDSIESIIKEVTFAHAPDAIGYLAQCLYKPMKLKEYNETKNLNLENDFEAIRVIHNCFFTREGDKNGYVMVTPFLKKERKKTDQLFDLGGDEDTKEDVALFERHWEVASAVLRTSIENPYFN